VREIGGLIERLEGDRVALVAFSGEAREVAPLTHDRTTLAALLETVTPDDNTQGGTNLGAALERALALFDGRTGAHEAIVLVTDGEDLEGRGLEIAQRAAERKIRVYVVGMATAEGGKIPLRAADGRETFLKDGSGADVISALDEASLRKIASVTGGEFLSAKGAAAPLEELFQKRISRLEGVARATGEQRVPHDRYQWPLALALCLALIEAALPEKRRASGLPAWVGCLAIGAQAPAPGGPVAPPDGTEAQESPAPPAPLAGDLRAGVAELRRLVLAEEHTRADELALALGARLEAERERVRAEGEHELARAYYDLGLAHARRERSGLAVASFRSARALAGPTALRRDSGYNAGTAQLQAAEALLPGARAAAQGANLGPPSAPAAPEAPPDPLAQALSAYAAARTELALRLREDSRDVDTRANLELCQKRIRELERLEQERQQQQQQQQQQDSQAGQQGEQDPSQSKPQGSEKPQEQQGDRQQPPGQEPPKQDQQQPPQEAPPQDARQEQPPQGEQQPKPDDSEPDPTPGEKQTGQRAAGGEPRELTKEEVLQLLDQLAEIEREGRAVRAALRRHAKKPVEKDW
jgi:Ca-activated chloride channel family protein